MHVHTPNFKGRDYGKVRAHPYILCAGAVTELEIGPHPGGRNGGGVRVFVHNSLNLNQNEHEMRSDVSRARAQQLMTCTIWLL